ncbi:4-alpha-glucanotransferase [Cereibacter sphaeroides]|uniref:4-alpha-glucanotransferase n=1 Tax=Cereibacter sphaeroides TaxID=1063 RepID=UPI001F22E63D|nr:4-alpha-glucanotransferase [Cereibacter sphaeroides]MCE6961517.1 4-alpha-glucanotransferase [Cereibacter sphaeroides]MCE6967832.1 4-alpha-glucanotransferase [Cereibacter sphaeroides]MCE6972580.1 4-alpha-glucanotransferase [Cereibacter sphaeroides]
MTETIEERAARVAIQPSYHALGGEFIRPPVETLRRLLEAFGIPPEGPMPEGQMPVLRGPEGEACFMPEGEMRLWGIAAQLYQIRSGRNWGIGDFADLCELARIAGAVGADFIGLNPLHALFLANPAHTSPFSPSNRRFLNPLYIAVDRVPGYRPEMAPDSLAALRAPELVDYPAVAEAKLAALRVLWQARPHDPADFARFREEGGDLLHRHALFEAISARMAAEGHGAGWRGWPEAFHDSGGPAARAFAEQHAEEVDFHVWLQWLADRQLGEARDACRAAGMRIGLYLDFAVGEVADGSSTWSDPSLAVPGVRIGASPDWFNAQGQDWGLAPLSPVKLAECRAEPFAALMEDATRRAGALRIDHAMGVWQLFLIPDGMTAPQGTYARYPVEDMLRALARASRKNRTIIIGEDLGNVPDGFRGVMQQMNILSYRILLFERHDHGYIAPQHYPREALVCLSTHDLPTFRGWWRGDDVEIRARFHLISDEAARHQADFRRIERRQLLEDLGHAGLLPWDEIDRIGPEDPPEALIVAVHRHLARAPSRLFAVRIEDMAGEVAPVNVPSTVSEYPNWRRKLGVPLEQLADTPLFRDIAGALAAERPREPT